MAKRGSFSFGEDTTNRCVAALGVALAFGAIPEGSHQVGAIKPKAFRPPSDWSHRGEMTKAVLSILRQAAEPLTSRDIALELLVTRMLDKDDQKLLALMTKHVGVTLRLQRIIGIVRSSSGTGQYMIWEIAR